MEQKTYSIAINGFGRIGRAFYRMACKDPSLNIVAINDLGDIHNLMYLLRYDSAQGFEDFEITVNEDGKSVMIEGKKVTICRETDPHNLPWKDLGIDIVIESTGFFTNYKDAKAHIDAGAKRVVISAPAKGAPVDGIEVGTALIGVNDDRFKSFVITSNASCTTNAGSPLLAILDEAIGIEKAMLNTVHGYTATQKLVDSPDAKDFRRGRAAAVNIVPTSTGAAQATADSYPKLKGLFDGVSMRVPVVSGSIADITFIASRNTTVEEVNEALTKAAATDRWKEVFAVTTEPLVSSDIIGSHFASIADLDLTRVVGGNLVKVLAWYDNEMGYTSALVIHTKRLAAEIK